MFKKEDTRVLRHVQSRYANSSSYPSYLLEERGYLTTDENKNKSPYLHYIVQHLCRNLFPMAVPTAEKEQVMLVHKEVCLPSSLKADAVNGTVNDCNKGERKRK